MDGALKQKGNSNVGEIFLISIVIFAVCGLGLVLLSEFGNSHLENNSPSGLSETRRLTALVKGSIYESGEAMSVFGTCVDAYDVPVLNSTADFSAWYPNGTQFIFDIPMTQLAQGYFLYEGNMSVVQGTYLTQLVCQAFLSGVNQTATAWGEWQNPFWVARIANISADVANLSNQIEVGFNNTISNITFVQETMVNEFNNTNQLILDTQVIANSSVDRNNSYLAYLLWMIINGTGSALNTTVTWDDFEVDRVSYWTWWTIKTRVHDAYGAIVSDPEVACTINTTLHPLQYMDEEGSHFTVDLFIDEYIDDFYYTTTCFRV